MLNETIAQIYKEETGENSRWQAANEDEHGLCVYIEGPTKKYLNWLESKIKPKKGCDVCNNGQLRLESFTPDKYIYCPWCSRELPDA
jgi:hypothetical protein